VNGLNSFDKTDGEYSLALTDLIRFWRSKVKVTPWFKYLVLYCTCAKMSLCDKNRLHGVHLKLLGSLVHKAKQKIEEK